jgi:uncharacterized membrane protein
MPTEIITAAAQAFHHIGAVVMTGGLFFLLFILRPVSREAMNAEERQLFFQLIFRKLLRWQWIALLLLWASGIWTARAFEIGNLPLTVQIMAAGGGIATVLTLAAHITCYFRLSEQIEAQHWGKAARISSYVRMVMAVNLLVCLLLVLAGVAGPALQTLGT